MEPNLTTVRTRRAQIAKLRQALDDEDKRLEITEQELTRLGASAQVSNGHTVTASNEVTVQQPVTQKDLVIATLRTYPTVWVDSSRELHTAIERTHGVNIANSSFMPLLTSLKSKGIIRRDARNRIALAERV